jgi:cobaltochelatase CobN
MKKEGYAGAGEMRSFVEYLWGWDATASETVTDGMWKETFDVYVDDKRKMGLPEFFEKSSPFAYQDITARMLETVRKGYWKADAATEKKLLEEYVDSVNRHGVGCAEHTCGNPRLQQYVMERGIRAGIPVPDLEGFKREMEKATGQEIDPAAEREEAFSRQNDAQMAARLAAVPAPSRNARQLEGYLMEERDRSTQARNEARQDAPPNEYAGALASLPVLGLLLAWRWTKRRRA